ncbi:hypothetical protein Tmar_1699 [Thermaerobacter marianensis DSM 12885]|uniref:DUF7916 domain-containing protein n=1 Tax=Thermaerobacter marianensis (strain ATCC 700841 / DSM 12885 / JCM 10246 / 7p75a) TaxID=644966 RepID=E6SHL2_THEM7|nr:hypothetical protein [Thermaerobacter marianensis]ADU51807.1 hypothetical protein Tmar_1699 [Thermaerobacter marianensis DSM 12885]
MADGISSPGPSTAAAGPGAGLPTPGPRLLELPPARLVGLRGTALRQAIAASEGRVLAAEVVAVAPPLVDGVTNGELAAAFGADLLLVNVYDVLAPRIAGLPGWDEPGAGAPAWAAPAPPPAASPAAPPGALPAPGASAGATGSAAVPPGSAGSGEAPAGSVAPPAPRASHPGPLAALARLTGRVVGINLEPSERVPSGRRATPENALRAVEQGAQWILLTGNPHTGVTAEGIQRAAEAIRRVLAPDRLLLAAGRMHGAGAWYGEEPFLDETAVRALVTAGVDVVALPAPATVPGVTVEQARRWVEAVHAAGALAMSTIGTSQEGADEGTLRQIALMSKACGFDLHHLGDAGYHGVALPENILAYGIAIRGRRHTYRRMALSAWRE